MQPTDPTVRRAAFAAWHDRIAPVFDVAQQLLVVDATASEIRAESRLDFAAFLPAGRALQLSELAVDVLVCGAISRPLAVMVTAQGIRLIPFVAGPLDEIVSAWLRGRLETGRFAMPGCCGRGRRRGAGATGEETAMNTTGGGNGGGGGGGRGGGGMGRGGGPRAGGPGGICVCPKCGHEEPHVQGSPCAQQKCSQCGVALRRK